MDNTGTVPEYTHLERLANGVILRRSRRISKTRCFTIVQHDMFTVGVILSGAKNLTFSTAPLSAVPARPSVWRTRRGAMGSHFEGGGGAGGTNAVGGVDGTGGGGGGKCTRNAANLLRAGDGGSGIVIIRYEVTDLVNRGPVYMLR